MSDGLEAIVARYGVLAERLVAAQEDGEREGAHAAVLACTLALGTAPAEVRKAALARVVVPVLRERLLRGVVVSRRIHAAGGTGPALALVTAAMQLADALCAVFGAAWTVAASDSPDDFCLLLVTLCATTIRTRAPSGDALTACASVLQHAITFLACDDDEEEKEEGKEENWWWTHLQARTLLAVRARIVETLDDVCEALAEPDGAATLAAPALARLLAEWIVLDDDGASSTPDSVAVHTVRSFGGSASRAITLLRGTHLDGHMPPALFALLCQRLHDAESL